jgi:CubicO group peptidase (beta-lactamase class C family)
MDQDLTEFARDECRRLQVPGLAFGVVHDGRMDVAAVGVTNVEHRLEVTPQTYFQVGSTSRPSRLLRSCSLPRRAHRPRARVRDYLPGSGWNRKRMPSGSRSGTSSRTTPGGTGTTSGHRPRRRRHRTHRGEARTVAAARALRDGILYCNSAFYVLAHIVEAVAALQSFVRERIFAPRDEATYFPEALPGRVAAGHIVTAEGPKVARPWHVPRAIAGGGGVISTVEDQLRYAASHLPPGSLRGVEPLLREETIAFMQSELAPAGSMCAAVGVSWMLDEMAGRRLVKHGGATNGHLSSFELFPDAGYACTVLTNSDGGREARDTIAAACRRRYLGVEPDGIAPTEMSPAALAEYAGAYRASSRRSR